MAVLGKRRVSPHMLRLTLGAAEFPAGQKGGYVKLMLPNGAGSKATVRTYTIREQRALEIDVDFVVHADRDGMPGPATAWALSTVIGDTIEVGGPGPAKPLPPGCDAYLIAGDMTALPAIAANLEALSADATGLAVLEIADVADRQDLAAPPGVAIRWLVNPEPGARPELLVNALREHGWPRGVVHGWAASEFASMVRLRTYLREEMHLDPARLYLSSYWKSGLNEDDHRVAKGQDAEMQIASRRATSRQGTARVTAIQSL